MKNSLVQNLELGIMVEYYERYGWLHIHQHIRFISSNSLEFPNFSSMCKNIY